LSFLFVLGVLIFVHEFGHYAVAKRLGVRVLTFSLGFGPKLFNVRRGDTDYCVSAIPLGGYVKMAGENPDDSRTGNPDEFLSKTKWQRFQILIAGPVMNLLLAVVVMAIVLMQGVEVPAYEDQPPDVAAVLPDSPASKVGIRPGDRILKVAEEDVSTWAAFNMSIGTRANRDVSLLVQREGQTIAMTVRPIPETRYEIGSIGVLPDARPFIRAVNPGDPADRAGLKVDDEVLSVDGVRILLPRQLAEAISSKADREVDLVVRRNGQELKIVVTPEKRGDRGLIGVAIGQATRSFQPGPFEAVSLSVTRNIELTGQILKTVGGFFSGETSPRQLMGPIAIAQLSGESAQAGAVSLFGLMALISLNLGIVNLLPIPILDGGHIAILALEGITRRDFSVQVKEKMLLAGFVLLMMLMVTVIYNDLTRIAWIESLMPWRN
jgi:regulator of sigma E protease